MVSRCLFKSSGSLAAVKIHSDFFISGVYHASMFFRKFKHAFFYFCVSLALSACSPLSASEGSNNSWTLNDYLFPSVRHSTWAMMSERFAFTSKYEKQEVQHEVRWFKRNRSYFKEITRNAKPYLYFVYQEALKKNIPPEVALLPMIESNYNPFVFSRTGATGLWQIMPGTASGSGLKINWWYDGRRDIVASTDAALNYLLYLHHFFHDWLLAIAAYNAGAGTVQQAVRHNRKMGKPTDYWHLALPAETKYYVPKLLAIAAILHADHHDGVPVSPVPFQPYFTATTIKGQYNLPVLAKMAKIPLKQLRLLNPGFRRNTTPPNFSFKLLLPRSQMPLFKKNNALIKSASASWTHYTIEPGDTLSVLAKRYGTKTFIIKQVNHLKSDQLHLKQTLLIPSTTNSHIQFGSNDTSVAEDHLPGPSKVIHTVRRHDSIWSIAKDYHVKTSDILFWNNLSHYDLTPGTRLIIWQRHYNDRSSYFIHTVKKGDSLGKIAKRFAVNERLIKLYNGMHSSRIRLGQKLKIPRHHRRYYKPTFDNQLVIHAVRPGDSINSLAKYYRTTASNLCRWNHLKKNQLLKLGQSIKIYFTR